MNTDILKQGDLSNGDTMAMAKDHVRMTVRSMSFRLCSHESTMAVTATRSSRCSTRLMDSTQVKNAQRVEAFIRLGLHG
jgi:hypothetical protein